MFWSSSVTCEYFVTLCGAYYNAFEYGVSPCTTISFTVMVWLASVCCDVGIWQSVWGQWFEFRNNITVNRPDLLVHLSIIEGQLQDQERHPPRHLFSDKFWYPSSKLGSDGQAAAIGDVVQEREISTTDISVPRGGPVSCATPGPSGGELVVKKICHLLPQILMTWTLRLAVEVVMKLCVEVNGWDWLRRGKNQIGSAAYLREPGFGSSGASHTSGYRRTLTGMLTICNIGASLWLREIGRWWWWWDGILIGWFHHHQFENCTCCRNMKTIRRDRDKPSSLMYVTVIRSLMSQMPELTIPNRDTITVRNRVLEIGRIVSVWLYCVRRMSFGT